MVKTYKDGFSEESLNEGQILKRYHHPNIVKLIGIAAKRQPTMIVLEYLSGTHMLLI